MRDTWLKRGSLVALVAALRWIWLMWIIELCQVLGDTDEERVWEEDVEEGCTNGQERMKTAEDYILGDSNDDTNWKTDLMI